MHVALNTSREEYMAESGQAVELPGGVDLADCYRRMRKGGKVLDKKLQRWRQPMRKHMAEFEFASGEYCVLGTLGKYSPALKAAEGEAFGAALDYLVGYRRDRNHASRLGFDAAVTEEGDYQKQEFPAL